MYHLEPERPDQANYRCSENFIEPLSVNSKGSAPNHHNNSVFQIRKSLAWHSRGNEPAVFPSLLRQQWLETRMQCIRSRNRNNVCFVQLSLKRKKIAATIHNLLWTVKDLRACFTVARLLKFNLFRNETKLKQKKTEIWVAAKDLNLENWTAIEGAMNEV